MSKLIKKIRNSKGFTLIELLVVIAIIGLLATLAVVSLNNARQKSRDAKRVSDIRQIQTALDLYFLDQNAYPTGTNTALGISATCLSSGDGFDTACNNGKLYMGLIPRDPSASGAASVCSGSTSDSEGCDYSYSRLSATVYRIFFYLKGSVGNLSGGPHCANQNGIGNRLSGNNAVCP